VHVFDRRQKMELPDELPRAADFSVEVTPDNKESYYVHTCRRRATSGNYHAMGKETATTK